MMCRYIATHSVRIALLWPLALLSQTELALSQTATQCISVDDQARLRMNAAPTLVLPPVANEVASPLRPVAGAFPDVRAAKPLLHLEVPALKPQDVFKECEDCPEMVVVPAGEFVMGASEQEAGSTPDERPQHKVTIVQPFAVGRYAVTFAEWDTCVAAGGCNGYRSPDRGWGRGRQPVIELYWEDAKAFVRWLSKTTGRPYRLLSEAEREYVTRAGTTTAFWWGDTISVDQANFDATLTYDCSTTGTYRAKTLPVDSFKPNPWGLYQVHGNVYDWVEDCWNDSYEGAPSDGSAWTTGDCYRRILRGGSWSRAPQTLRSAARIGFGSDMNMAYFGMRVARTLKR